MIKDDINNNNNSSFFDTVLCVPPQVVDFDAGETEYDMRVTVRDPDETHTDTVQVRFIITDVNDNAPVFVPDVINEDLSEDADIGDSVATFTATDRDSGENGDFE